MKISLAKMKLRYAFHMMSIQKNMWHGTNIEWILFRHLISGERTRIYEMISDEQRKEFGELTQSFKMKILELMESTANERDDITVYCYAMCEVIAGLICVSKIHNLEKLCYETIAQMLKRAKEMDEEIPD